MLPDGVAHPRGMRGPVEVSLEERLRLLSELQLFSGLTESQLQPLAEVAQLLSYDLGDSVVRQNEAGDSVYVIVTGRVQVVARVEHEGIATEAIVSNLVAGETLGELSLLDGKPRSASCIALAPTTCLRLERLAFVRALERHWTLTLSLLSVVAQRLRVADARLAEHARDPLTGLYSRRALVEFYAREVSRTKRAARTAGVQLRPMAVLFMDVDRFKEINDRYGHHTGDAVLRSAAYTLSMVTRATDVVARYGGDEFVVLMPEVSPEGAQLVADRLRDWFMHSPPGPVPFSVSIGLTMVDPGSSESVDLVMARADAAMYQDKSRLGGPAQRSDGR